MNYLIVDANNNILNTIAWDGVSPYTPPTGTTLVQFSGPASIGWTWNGTEAVNPNPPPPPTPSVPQSVTMLQARLAILQQTAVPNLMTAVNNAVNADTTGVLAAWWEYSPTVDRQNAQLLQVANAIGMTSAQLDALFTAASAIPT